MIYRYMDQFDSLLLKFFYCKKFSFFYFFLIKKEVTIHTPLVPNYKEKKHLTFIKKTKT